VVDADGNEVPVGGVGELCIGGASLARGYLGRGGLTAERFVPDRWGGAGGRLYRTGDVCRRRGDGTVEFLGRQDQQVKLRGQRIEPGEVEAALRAERGVRDAVALVRGEGEARRLVAYVAGEADGAALKGALVRRLPGYLVPSVVMVLEALPVMANGKLDRAALPEPAAAEPRAMVAARTAAEAALLGVWRSVLGRDDLGVTENFFEVGGDSILSLQIIARAREAGWHLTPRQVFEQPTIEAAARVAERLPEVAATAAEASGPLVLTPIQAGFFARHPQGQAHWNQSVLLTVRGVLDVAALRRVLSALVARHEALRLRFRRDAGGAWQPGIAAAETSELLEVQELSDAPDWAARLAAGGTRLQRSLDLAHGPLLRALYARLAGGEGRLLLTVHHLAVDGVSWRVLLAELQTGLAQAERGEAIALAGEGTPWGEWARRLAAYAGRAEVAAELGWWQAMLAGVDGSLPVPAVAERRPGGRYLGERYLGESRTVEWRLDREQTRRLLREVPRAYRTRVDEVLLAALARVLGAWCGRSEVLVELEGHGREDVLAGVELSRTVGWFTTTYPVVLPVAAEAAATLVGVKERLREVPANGLHYGLLAHLGDAATRSALAGLARPWVSFNYLGQFDQSLEAGGRFGFATEAAGASMDPASPLDCALELNGLVAGGELSLSWRYVPGELADETVEGLAAAFGAELAGLIAHCAAAPAGATASDFPLSGLTQAELAGLGLALGEVEDLYPATPVQQGLLFHSLLEPGSGVYVNQLRLTLSGKLDASALRAAWQSAVSRHAVLRTGFVWRHGGEPLQVVQRSVALPWTEQDWSGEGDYEAALAAWRAADVARGFELSQAPLLRLALFRRPDGAHDLLWTTHHLLLDGWSAARLLEQVEQDYQALVSGRPARPVAVARYRDYVAWLQAQPGAEAWWRERLAALDEPAMLGDALERPAAAEAGVQRLTHRLDEVASARLRAAAQRHQVTLNTLMQAAFALLLARCSGRAEVVFGATVAGRPAALPGVERMVGLFINSLPVWVKVPAALPVSAWLAALQAQASELRQYEHTRLADVQAWAGRPGEPLFDALMVFENYPVEALSSLDATGLAVSRAEMVERSHYPLTVTISPGAAVEIEWAWDGAAFARAAMQRLLAGYAAILAQMAEAGGAEAGGAEADRAVGSIGLTVAPAAARPLPGYRFRPVAERIAERAVLAPAAVAVGCGEAVLDRAGLEAWSNRIAQRLRRLGVASEERVGLCVERSAGMVAGLLGILKSGAAYVPLDPAYPVERLRLMLDDAAVRCVVSDAASAAALGDGPAGLQRVMITEVAAEPAVAPPVRVQPDQLAYVIYTSGSTGRPKGVGVSHAALDRFLASMAVRPGLDASDVWLSVTSPSFDIAALELYLPLLAGARVEIAPREAVTDGQRLAGLVEQCGATVLQATPSGWRLLLEGGWPGRALKGLCGGEALAADLAAALQRRGVELWNMYGPTETTIWSSLASLPAASEVSLGEAIHDTTLHLLDEAGQAVPEGGCGELCIGGANLARGYLNRPGLTAASFVPDPFGPAGVRLYRTGDLCRRRDDGTLVFLGRRDQQVKLRGHRIELGEIEAALRAQPGVRDAVAILHGPGDARRIVAYAATEQDPTALAHAIAPLLPPPARPSTIITLQAIPTTPNGKRDRSRLPHPTTQPRPYIPPQSHTETMLAHIWARVLERDNISRTDNFFEIGGDSLRALRVATLARNAGLPWVTPAALFTHSVLAALANDARPSGHAQNVAVMNRQGSQRTLFCIHPGYGLVSEYRALAQELDGCVTVYGVESPIYADPDWRACDLDDLARHYVDCVRQVQPDGPYSLLGWSHGGLVAVAMAHRFRRDGHAVQFVGLVDVAADIPEEPVSATPDDDQADIVDLLREIGDPRWQAADLLTHDAEIVRQAVAVIRHQDALVRGYRIPRLDVPLTVWWAGQSLPRPAAQLDWRRHTTAGVCAEGQIDTDHKTIIRHPAFLASVRHELLRSG
jgi:amino acid adenylation domain-containing protein/non-ribosomal peptide synthase protein (TIGR01720 family)